MFSSHAAGHPKFYDWYGSVGNFAITLNSGGVGFVIVAELSPAVISVSADVGTAAGDSVEMRAWNDSGNLVGFVVAPGRQARPGDPRAVPGIGEGFGDLLMLLANWS